MSVRLSEGVSKGVHVSESAEYECECEVRVKVRVSECAYSHTHTCAHIYARTHSSPDC